MEFNPSSDVRGPSNSWQESGKMYATSAQSTDQENFFAVVRKKKQHQFPAFRLEQAIQKYQSVVSLGMPVQ